MNEKKYGVYVLYIPSNLRTHDVINNDIITKRVYYYKQ